MSAESAVGGAIRIDLHTESVAVDDPFEAFLALRSTFGEDDVALFESLGGPDIDNRSALIQVGLVVEVSVRDRHVEFSGTSDVIDILAARLRDAGLVNDVVSGAHAFAPDASVWDIARACQAAFDAPGADDRSFDVGFCAVLGYELAGEIEDLRFDNPATDDLPDLVFRLYSTTVSFDLATGTSRLITATSHMWAPPIGVRAVLSASRPPAPEPAVPDEVTIVDSLDQAAYLAKAEEALEHIRAGDIYQVQIGHDIWVRGDRDDVAVYQRMRRDNPSPYMGFLPFGPHVVLSGSPELHVRVSGDSLLMRPIAGTARRGGDPVENERNRQWLLGDLKEAAEHVMLVDLCRNDLGRVATTGSVEVEQLMTVEEYSHVYHLVSTVSARLDPRKDVYDVICATFPAGTMTGAPKIRAMEIIDELEESRRGFYAGIFGLIGFGGFANLALSIRTVVAGPEGYSLRASAGIVIDSSPESEWNETLAKMGAPARATTGRDLL